MVYYFHKFENSYYNLNQIFKMRRIVAFLLLSYVLIQNSFTLLSQDIILKQTNISGIYKKGEKIKISAFTGNQIGDSLFIRILKNNKQPLLKKALKIENDSVVLFEGSFTESCSLIAEARSKTGTFSLGAIVDPYKLKPGSKAPSDFNKYWDQQKKLLGMMKMDIRSTPVTTPVVGPGYSCVDIEINCMGPKPVRGYFAKPDKAAPKSLPVVLLVHAAGVKGSWCRSEPGSAMNYAKKGALCFDLNAHGMLNGQSENYYADLENGELKNYQTKGITNRDDVYFRGMYLRLLRTIDFLTQQPEWDGKRILVMGESQGGGQSLVAAGLDHRVSAVVAIVPAMCDWLAPLSSRKGGWPQPFETDASKDEMLKAIPYFDAANILKGSKATIFVEIGLIDQTCPSTSVYTAVNQSKGKKIIVAVPYRPHQTGPLTAANMKIWQETVYKPREQFISDYLK
jgi:cephalosporin-C deacetylase